MAFKDIKLNFTFPVFSLITLPDGKEVKVVEKKSCVGCYFRNKDKALKGEPACEAPLFDIIGYCSYNNRSDGKSVIYKLVKKTKSSKNQ